MPLYGPSQQTIINILADKQPVRVATTANITIATALNNGDTLDGVVLATGDRVLVKDQAAPAENGIYVVAASPARSSDFNAWSEIPGAQVTVLEGTANADSQWLCTADAGGTLGTTAITWVQRDGNVTGPASSTDNALTRWNGTTGKSVQNSGWILADTDELSGAVDGVEETGLSVTASGTDGVAIEPRATGLGAVAVNAINLTNAGVAIQGVTQVNGGVGIVAGTTQAGATAFQILNSGGFKASFTNAGTADRAISVPDLAGTLVVGSTGTTDEALVRTDGTASGKVQGSTVLVDDSGNMTFPTGSSIRVPTGATMAIQVFDTNDATLRQFMLATSGATPNVDWSAPSGGTLTINATSIGATTAGTGAFTTLSANSLSGTTAITGGAGNMTVISGTGASRTLIFQTTTAGGTATTALTLNADQTATFASDVLATGMVQVGASQKVSWSTRARIYSPGDGKIQVRRASDATGATLDFITTADTMKVRNLADNADGGLTAGATTLSGALTLSDVNIVLGTSTGTQIGTSATQKLVLWGGTPVVRPAVIAGPSGGAVEDAEARAAINSILSLLVSIGAMSSS